MQRIDRNNNSSSGAPAIPSMGLTVRPISVGEHVAFVQEQRSVSFLQTPAWGRVKTEWRSESLGWYDGPRMVGAGLVLHRPVPRAERFTLAYLPWGPVIDWTGEISAWLGPLTTWLKERGAFAIRIAPPVRTTHWDAPQVKAGIADPGIKRLTEVLGGQVDPVGTRVVAQLIAAGWRPQSPADGFGVGQPQFTHEIPLRHPNGTPKTEEDLLSGMNQLWRRNIKKATKAGVDVITSRHSDDLRAFHDLYVLTAQRDGFTPRPLSYFETMVAQMHAEDPERVGLYLARHQGRLVAATIGVRVGAYAWYSYGASSTDRREVRGSNACQWAMIRDARAAGCDIYDLRGITPTLDAADPHVGLIRFKVGAGGRAVRYVGEWDLPLRPMTYRAFGTYMKYRGQLRKRQRSPDSRQR